MGFYEQVGICATVASIPTLLLFSQFMGDPGTFYPLIGIPTSLLIPFFYNGIRQRQKRSKIAAVLNDYNVLYGEIARDSKKDMRIVIANIINDLENLRPYIQDAYDARAYVNFMQGINALKQLHKLEPMPDLRDYLASTIRNLELGY